MPTDYEESIGNYLRRKLAERGLSQNQAALRMGVSSGMVNTWVKGNRKPSPESVVKIAGLLAVGVDELMIRAGHRRPVETDLHPLRRELLEVARQVPIKEAELAIEFLVWRTQQAALMRFHPHQSKAENSTTSAESNEEGQVE